jgi:hypothetical protein
MFKKQTTRLVNAAKIDQECAFESIVTTHCTIPVSNDPINVNLYKGVSSE